MSYAKLYSAGTYGIDAYIIEVEVDISRGLPGFNIVGLASKAVDESKDRVRGAIKNSGFIYPDQKITVNLAPADVKKEGAMYDLAIAIGILIADRQIEPLGARKFLFAGELSLDGRVRSGKGILPIVSCARQKKFDYVFLPKKNLTEASLVPEIKIAPVESLKNIILSLQTGQIESSREKIDLDKFSASENEIDFAYIRGQENAKRSLTISAAGGHNLLMTGPPGAGKTLLARALPGILTRLTLEECLEVTRIYSISGRLIPGRQPIVASRPFRSPHHTASHIALVGGGSFPLPGEITLAHRGVLFLDELPEFPRLALETLRQPLEEGTITVSRASGSITYPADFIFVASCNPCPCGYLGDPKKACVCSNSHIASYQKKISGPLLDRIDLQVQVPRVNIKKLSQKPVATPSREIRRLVERTRKIQAKRFTDEKNTTNAKMDLRQIEKYCQLDDKNKNILKTAVENMNVSARGYHKILKISRTIADLEQKEKIVSHHLMEAVAYYENR